MHNIVSWVLILFWLILQNICSFLIGFQTSTNLFWAFLKKKKKNSRRSNVGKRQLPRRFRLTRVLLKLKRKRQAFWTGSCSWGETKSYHILSSRENKSRHRTTVTHTEGALATYHPSNWEIWGKISVVKQRLGSCLRWGAQWDCCFCACALFNCNYLWRLHGRTTTAYRMVLLSQGLQRFLVDQQVPSVTEVRV